MSIIVQIRVLAADSGLSMPHQLLGELKNRTGLNRNLATEAKT